MAMFRNEEHATEMLPYVLPYVWMCRGGLGAWLGSGQI